jgi:DMSO reductase anchor subunit
MNKLKNLINDKQFQKGLLIGFLFVIVFVYGFVFGRLLQRSAETSDFVFTTIRMIFALALIIIPSVKLLKNKKQ